jgi:hypothetical protein
MMQYTLITKNGKILQFYVKAVAETYKQIYGGYIVSEDILIDKTRIVTKASLVNKTHCIVTFS